MRSKTGPSDRPLRAVVCDDAPDLRDLVADLLRLRGHEVTVVGDGPAAIELIVAERPDVALIDIGLARHGRLRGRAHGSGASSPITSRA